jgi:hypothetical protein
MILFYQPIDPQRDHWYLPERAGRACGVNIQP